MALAAVRGKHHDLGDLTGLMALAAVRGKHRDLGDLTGLMDLAAVRGKQHDLGDLTGLMDLAAVRGKQHDLGDLTGLMDLAAGMTLLIWLLVILLTCTWMIWNIQGRVIYFLSRPTAVTTEMKFKDKMVFPKVTICNQNTFRSSKVYNETTGPRTSASLYEAIDRYMQVLQDDTGHQSARQKFIERYGELLSDKNVREFYRRVAHQKNTFINRCMWKGRKCGPEHFIEVFTNMGVCYQFNTSTDDMVVDKANKDGGLDLMLFVD
ncbi:acid-sensing ion channel 1B-like [Gigantopelta aegis]|uniref:acid-sensing ion channel 1B-like n=1 Tax=Gigantopelta aegis TaxID=1735272 RepID=UPI001B887952|nr:acid-sensing ion channel 1B-like [Gigantopelta aegis]